MRKKQPVTIRRNLLSNLLLIIVILSAAIILSVSFYIRRTIQTLSLSVIAQTVEQVKAELDGFFGPVSGELLTASGWAIKGMTDLTDRVSMNRVFIPLVRHHPQISSALAADSEGREYLLLQTGQKWMNRETRTREWGEYSRVTEWTDADPTPVVTWRHLRYDPHERPWYRGAVERKGSRSEGEPKDESAVFWTRPYTFFTTKDPGITASLTVTPENGAADITLAFDVLLTDISKFTVGLLVSENGQVMVMSDEDYRVIGLPRSLRKPESGERITFFLKTPDEIGIPTLSKMIRTVNEGHALWREVVQIEIDGEPCWAGIRKYPLSGDRLLHIAVIIPEKDILGGLKQFRLFVGIIALSAVVFAVLNARRLSRRFSSPVELLVAESDRISRGDLEPGPPIDSSVFEFQRLAEAHERMRRSLQVLLRLEKDIQLARRIQMDTLPRHLPNLKGYRITAWNEPVEGAAGDTYDIIGLERDPVANGFKLAGKHAESAVFLLADATGHGIGPALSATQVRAMLRMAVHTGWDLSTVVKHMNTQLFWDLKGGRFITAWFGVLDTTIHRLSSFSAGQGPLFHFAEKDDRCRIYSSDAPALGVLEDLQFSPPEPIDLNPGDVFMVLSDGLIEPADAEGRIFGKDRVMEIVRAHRTEDPKEILDALLEDIRSFTGGKPPEDDRTAVIIKREK
jgi:serine phosphatase RsbU (regulator of sigma subunit)